MSKDARQLSKAKRGESGAIDAWLVPYGNLMTIMMIFFLVLWAFAYFMRDDMAHYEKVLYSIQKSLGAELQKKEKELDMAERMNSFVKDKGLSKVAQVNVSVQKIKLVLRTPVLFVSGSAELMPEIFPLLDEISKYLTDIHNPIMVEGHTDNIPIAKGKYKTNYALSAARAFGVIKYFIDKGVEPERLSVVGYGEYEPLKPNDTPENRSLNRRIEISILRDF